MLNLYELAQVIDEKLGIRIKNNQFVITFIDCQIKEIQKATLISEERGIGESVDEAADDYFKKISGKWLVFKSMDKRFRREYSATIYQKKGT